MVSVGCAHRGNLRIETTKLHARDHDERAVVTARDGGFVVDVQYLKYGRPVGPVRVHAKRVDDDTVELHIDYRPGRYKCVSTRAARVTVRGLDAGTYDVVVRRGDTTITTSEVSVPAAVDDQSGRLARRIAEPGC
jgi:hypothetical protein